MMLIAIDPGINTGWAVLSYEGIIACGHGEEWPLDCWGSVGWEGIIERPEVYAGKGGPGNPNNIVTLAIRVGMYEERLRVRGIRCEEVLPKHWKGQVDKPIHHRRGRLKMTDKEKQIVDEALSVLPKGQHHDVLDACNLGLWKTGRLPR